MIAKWYGIVDIPLNTVQVISETTMIAKGVVGNFYSLRCVIVWYTFLLQILLISTHLFTSFMSSVICCHLGTASAQGQKLHQQFQTFDLLRVYSILSQIIFSVPIDGQLDLFQAIFHLQVHRLWLQLVSQLEFYGTFSTKCYIMPQKQEMYHIGPGRT